MGKTYPELDDGLRAFIASQHLFFVATAPRDGHINLSPKGLDSFRILAPRRVGYADFTGSGVETIAHLRENGRITIMFCAFEGKPNILRLYGSGRVVEPAEPEYATLLPQFNPPAQPRALILADLTRITDSCGFGIPLYDYRCERTLLPDWCQRKGPEGIAAYQQQKNAASIDGLPGLRSATTG